VTRSLSAFDVVRRFPGLRVLVVGDAMLDTYLEGVAERLCKEGPIPVVRREAVGRAPGGAANVAANLAALGADVMFVAIVGADDAGAVLRSSLHQLGVSDRWLVEDPAVSTIHKLRVVANDQYVVRFDEGDTRDCLAGTHDRLIDNATDAFARCDLLVCPDYGYGVLSERMIDHLAGLRRHRDVVMAVDAKDVLRFRSSRATILTPNLAEARRATGLEHVTLADPVATGAHIARRLLDLVDAEHVAVTMAGDGVALCGRREAVHLPTHPVARAGDVGAGDSFTAALALALAAGADPATATRIGMDAAAIAITRRRTSVVAHRDLLRRASLDGQQAALDLHELVACLDRERWAGRRIVFTNGVFDILHAGHVQLLQRAKRLGDVLVVGINSDGSTRRLKGPTRPINREQDRLALVSALEPVDYAILFDGDTPADLIRALRPDVHVKGGDYTPDSLPERDAVAEVGARIEILSLVEGRSTTGVIGRIADLVHTGMLEAAE
jgi:D-beta-D-heptose 7-phosphate kinase / D-beta-D-heptose 1-phosphate adenosyltransferase